MGLMDDILASDAAIFADPDVFGEQLTYRKARSAAYPNGTTRTVCGVVERMSPMPGPTPSGGLAPKLRITFPNNTTRGISSAEWQNGDAILVSQRYGGTPEWLLLHWPSDTQQHDAGMVTFECR